VKAAIFDPYLDTGGGGERYVLTVASILVKQGWGVDIFWENRAIGNWLEKQLGIDLSRVNFVPDLKRGRGYDFVFWLSDGSIPTLFAKKNVLHFQTPFTKVNGKSLFNRLKFFLIHKIVCNSQFTKRFIDREYGVSSSVIYPPVDTEAFKSQDKENIILYVGRFSALQQAKRQDILIKNFKELKDGGLRGWKLVLAGASNIGGKMIVRRLKRMASGYPIEILENLPFEEVKQLYGKAKIFWSAAGFDIDEDKDPQRTEHFGISVVEAMAAGCVPVILGKGGHKEIIESGKNGFLWNTQDELQKITKELITYEKRRESIAEKAQETSKRFGIKRFEKEILMLAYE
jgi:glycosyltransferase involved in cell wall biosynthesis